MARTFEISGAGPAGLAAAIVLARAGAQVTVYERRTRIGGRFHGDLQGLENWSTAIDVHEELAAAGIPVDTRAQPVTQVVCFEESGREHVCKSAAPVFYLNRRGPDADTLDSFLAARAAAAGVQIQTGTACHQLRQGGIAAGGPRQVDAISVGYVFETDAADGAYAVFSDSFAPKGYGYLLVSRGRGTLASCMFENFHAEREYLQRTADFFQRHVGVRMHTPRLFGGVGAYFYPAAARKGGLLFAGESAGFQDAFWGFGMRYAMLSGALAAQALLANRPGEYDRLWQTRLAGYLQASIVNRSLYNRTGPLVYRRFLRRLACGDAREHLHALYRPSRWKQAVFPLAQAVLRKPRQAVACGDPECTATFCVFAHRQAYDT